MSINSNRLAKKWYKESKEGLLKESQASKNGGILQLIACVIEPLFSLFYYTTGHRDYLAVKQGEENIDQQDATIDDEKKEEDDDHDAKNDQGDGNGDVQGDNNEGNKNDCNCGNCGNCGNCCEMYVGYILQWFSMLWTLLGFLIMLAMLLNICFEFTFAWGYVLLDDDLSGFPVPNILWCIFLIGSSHMILIKLFAFVLKQLVFYCLLVVWNTLDTFEMPIVNVWRLVRFLICLLFAIIAIADNSISVK